MAAWNLSASVLVDNNVARHRPKQHHILSRRQSILLNSNSNSYFCPFNNSLRLFNDNLEKQYAFHRRKRVYVEEIQCHLGSASPFAKQLSRCFYRTKSNVKGQSNVVKCYASKFSGTSISISCRDLKNPKDDTEKEEVEIELKVRSHCKTSCLHESRGTTNVAEAKLDCERCLEDLQQILDWKLVICKIKLFFIAIGSVLTVQTVFSSKAYAVDSSSVRKTDTDFRVGRRHHRRRLIETSSQKFEKHETHEPQDKVIESGNGDDGNLTIVLDCNALKQKAIKNNEEMRRKLTEVAGKARKAAHHAIHEASDIFANLRASVQLQPGGRLVVSIRRDTLHGAAILLGLIVLLSLAGKVILRFLQEIGFGWSGNSSGRKSKVIRDRSLGGREVRISSSNNPRFGANRSSSAFKQTSDPVFGARSPNPLDDVRQFSRSEKTLLANKAAPTAVKRQSQLPAWWPPPESYYPVNEEAKERGRREAQIYLQGMLDRRLGGEDFTEHNIMELCQMCRKNGVSVTVPTTNTRDALYRAASNVALSSCARGGSFILGVAPTSTPQFLSNFASAIGIDDERAARIISAAVAARMRSSFMQAWAFLKQSRQIDAKKELGATAAILSVFFLGPDSAEVDMVAQGIVPRLELTDRQQLFSIFRDSGGEVTKSVAAAALGLNNVESGSSPSPNYEP